MEREELQPLTIWRASPGQRLNVPLGLMGDGAVPAARAEHSPRRGVPGENRFGNTGKAVHGEDNRDNFFLQVGHPDPAHHPAFPKSDFHSSLWSPVQEVCAEAWAPGRLLSLSQAFLSVQPCNLSRVSSASEGRQKVPLC